MSAQKGPFGLKQTQTGRKAPERPTTPQECPKHHKTLWLVGYHWYDILSRTLRPFGYPSGAHWDRICPKTSLLVLIDDPMVATKDRKESKNFANYLSGLAPLMWSRAACFHTILAFPGTRCSLHKGLFCPPKSSFRGSIFGRMLFWLEHMHLSQRKAVINWCNYNAHWTIQLEKTSKLDVVQ